MDAASETEAERASAPAWLWFLLGFVAPAVVMFWDVIASDRNFAYRDAGHFYYPYYKLIASEWGAGRLPLWNPYENGGEPLAAQPTAAVWYPAKLLFVLPYPLAYKLYHLGHLALAWWSAFWCARMFGLSRGAAAFAGTAYSLSGFVIFQLYNIVFLVGAAWLPLGLAFIDRIVRTPTNGTAFCLAAVLAMQILGGDPEVAVLTLLVGLPYLLLFQFGSRGFRWGVGLLCLGHAVVFFARCLPTFQFSSEAFVEPSFQTLALGWFNAALQYPVDALTEVVRNIAAPNVVPFQIGNRVFNVALYLGWTGVAGLVVGLVLLSRGGGFRALAANRSLRSWLTAALVAGLLSAVQVLPTRDLVKVSDRSAPQAPHESAAFSMFPARVLEVAIPAVYGKQMPTDSRWAPFSKIENGIWTASLYLGLSAAALGLVMLRWRRSDPLLVWLSWTLVLTLWLSVGKYGGVYWFFDPHGDALNKPIDAPRDTKMYGVSDGLYRFCEETIPLFASFRYPEKCFLFCTLAIALLAAFGVERQAWFSLRLRRILGIGAVVGAVLIFVLWLGRGAFERIVVDPQKPSNSWGPFDAAGAWKSLMQALIHTTFAAAALWALGWNRRRSAVWLVALLAADLATANRWLTLTESQADIDAKPKLLAMIEEAEANKPSDGPFRIHRTRQYNPFAWNQKSDPDRVAAMNRWERDTLQPKYAVPWRMAYATTTGTMGIYDVEFFFAPWRFTTPEILRRQSPNVPLNMTYYPRVGYNLWGAKYFILPDGQPLDHDERGVYTMMATAEGVPASKLARSNYREGDYVLVENVEAFPRAWIVHEVDVLPHIYGLKREDRTRIMERLLYRAQDGAVHIWDKGVEYPLRQQIMIETSDPTAVLRHAAGGPPSPNETVSVVRDDPGQVELEATLDRPGFIVLANAYYRGWKATVDGVETPVLRGNRAMQAIPVGAGKHRIVTRYSCRSTWIGGAISLVSWLALGCWAVRRMRS